jgi:hypothetical protein
LWTQAWSPADNEGAVEADVEHVLDRRPLGEGQLAVLRALYEAGEDGLWMRELALTTGRTPHQVVGVLGALGNRTKRTPGFPMEHNRGIGLLIDWRCAGARWHYRLLPMTCRIMERLGLV